MTSLVDRIGVDVLVIILDRYLNYKSRLRFERTSKRHQELVIESFKRIKHPYISSWTLRNMTNLDIVKMMFRYGDKVKELDFGGRKDFIGEHDEETTQRMALQFPVLIKLPTNSFDLHRMYINGLKENGHTAS